jgi:hypothetical protein
MPERRHKGRNKHPISPDAIAIVQSLNSETVELEGRKITKREAHLTLLYMRSIRGDISCSVALQRIRAACRADKPAEKVGYLVVPEPMSDAAFAKYAYEQQAKFRDANYGKDD